MSTVMDGIDTEVGNVMYIATLKTTNFFLLILQRSSTICSSNIQRKHHQVSPLTPTQTPINVATQVLFKILIPSQQKNT